MYSGEPTPIDNMYVKFTPTLETKKSMIYGSRTVKYKGYSYVNAYSYAGIMSGFLEICGWFLRPNRNGHTDFFRMSENPTAIEVANDHWNEFWWDETPVDAIGQVNVIYLDEMGQQQQKTFSIGEGNSIYTMEQNDVLVNADVDDVVIQGILDEYFAPNASLVNFTPVDATLVGTPYLESGDYIELTSEDGETVVTYILNQTISGIQHLESQITSTNGELLEVINE